MSNFIIIIIIIIILLKPLLINWPITSGYGSIIW
jgi:hypothetical protein